MRENWSRNDSGRPVFEVCGLDDQVRYRFIREGDETVIEIAACQNGEWVPVVTDSRDADFVTNQNIKNKIGSAIEDNVPDRIDGDEARDLFEDYCSVLFQEMEQGDEPASQAVETLVGATEDVYRHAGGDEAHNVVLIEAHVDHEPSKRVETTRIEFTPAEWVNERPYGKIKAAYYSAYNVELALEEDDWYDLKDEWQDMIVEKTSGERSTDQIMIDEVLSGLFNVDSVGDTEGVEIGVVEDPEDINNSPSAYLYDPPSEAKISNEFRDDPVLWVRPDAVHAQLVEHDWDKSDNSHLSSIMVERRMKHGNNTPLPRSMATTKRYSLWPINYEHEDVPIDPEIYIEAGDGDREVDL
jgi:hypothetical protein